MTLGCGNISNKFVQLAPDAVKFWSVPIVISMFFMSFTTTWHHLKTGENMNNTYSMVRVKCVFYFTNWLCFKRNMYSSAICRK